MNFMNAEEIFEKGKELAMEKGKSRSKYSYIDSCSVGGDFSVYRDDYFYKSNGLKIYYSTAHFDDGSGKWESVNISLRASLFKPKKDVYSLTKEVGRADRNNFFQEGAWQAKFSELIQKQ